MLEHLPRRRILPWLVTLLVACSGLKEFSPGTSDGGLANDGGALVDSGESDASERPDGGDGAPVTCPSSDVRCNPETVVTGILSGGELATLGKKIAFREHGKVDGGTFSRIRVFDPAGACKVGSCLPTLAIGKNNYTLLAGSNAHLCHTSESGAVSPFITCANAISLADERTIPGETWFYQATFLDDDTLLYGAPLPQAARAVRVVGAGTTNPPSTVVGPVASAIDFVVGQGTSSSPWFAWYEQGARLAARTVSNPVPVEFNYQTEPIGLGVVGDQLVWASHESIHLSRFTSPGFGTPLPRSSFANCSGSTTEDYKMITTTSDAIISIEGCSVPGSLGSVLVRNHPDGKPPVLLASVPTALTSAVVLGDYVYYTLGRIQSDLGSQPTEELRRVRYR